MMTSGPIQGRAPDDAVVVELRDKLAVTRGHPVALDVVDAGPGAALLHHGPGL